MPRFLNLSDAIQYQINELSNNIQIPIGSTLAPQTISSLPSTITENPMPGVLRWGFSTWGVEPVTTINKPSSTIVG